MSQTEVGKLERLLDEVEELVETGRELLRKKASVSVQEEVFQELVDETRALMDAFDAEEKQSAKPTASPLPQRHRTPMGDGFAVLLKAARLKLALSQSELATKIGVKQPTISALELGRYTGSSEIRQRIRKVMSLPEGA